MRSIVDHLEVNGAIKRIRTYGRTILYRHGIRGKELAKPMMSDLDRRLLSDQTLRMFIHLLKMKTWHSATWPV